MGDRPFGRAIPLADSITPDASSFACEEIEHTRDFSSEKK